MFPREDFGTVAELILRAIHNSRQMMCNFSRWSKEFLDEVAIYDLGQIDDRTDFSVAFYDESAP